MHTTLMYFEKYLFNDDKIEVPKTLLNRQCHFPTRFNAFEQLLFTPNAVRRIIFEEIRIKPFNFGQFSFGNTRSTCPNRLIALKNDVDTEGVVFCKKMIRPHR